MKNNNYRKKMFGLNWSNTEKEATIIKHSIIWEVKKFSKV